MDQLLDEHHVAAISDDEGRRKRFATEMETYFAGQTATRPIRLGGAGIDNLEALELQLRIAAGGHDDHQQGLMKIAAILRRRGAALRRQIFLWEEADAFLERDVDLFGRVVNLLLSVAVERELLDDDRLVIQRVIMIGGPKLGAYAEYAQGQFCRWHSDSAGLDLDAAHAAVAQPRVLIYRIND